MTQQSFDPNAKAQGDNIFGLAYTEKNARVVYIPIPWDVTTSYQAGTHKGPKAILLASAQIDLFDLDYGNFFEQGLYMRPVPTGLLAKNKKWRTQALKVIAASDEKMATSKLLQKTLAAVNRASEELNTYIYEECRKLLAQGKRPIVVGGDHSVPFGAIRAYAEKYKDFGILHVDAHSDTRKAYMGFEHSHASIMRNVLEKIPSIKKLVQVGIRDFCQEEYEVMTAHPKVKSYFDLELSQKKINGTPFSSIAKEIVQNLPQNVYLSFDIDGLDPRYCPHTGTPVPGGLEYHEFLALIREIISSGRKLVGLDLVEVAPGPRSGEWDANVGMRLLYKLTGAMLRSEK